MSEKRDFLKMWSYDLAREQSPTRENLRTLCKLSIESGYNAFAIYLEHRFQYPSVDFESGIATSLHTLNSDDIRAVSSEFSELQIIPMINVLGHMEGFLRSVGTLRSGKNDDISFGESMSEQPFKGLQACPCQPEVIAFADQIVMDIMDVFTSKIIHIGGDETSALGSCPVCQARSKELGLTGDLSDEKAALYVSFYLPLIQKVIAAGRRPAIWGDMLLAHPSILESLPKETLIFDWQYFNRPLETIRQFQEAGFEVIGCPSIQTYNAPWAHLEESDANLKAHIQDVEELSGSGICLTTWEMGLFGSYETLLPAIRSAGRMINDVPGSLIDGYSGDEMIWAELMGIELGKCGKAFAFSETRSGLKCRFMLYRNPFLFWLRQQNELHEPNISAAKSILQHAIAIAPNSAMRGVSEFVFYALEFAHHAQLAAESYRRKEIGETIHHLAPCRQFFDHIERIAIGNQRRFGGSMADPYRAVAAREHLEHVIRRVKDFGDGSLGYRPSFETLTHPKFIPYDQANWWLVNTWANE